MYLDEPGAVGTKGAQMWTGVQKISAGVRYCPKVFRSALKCAGADPSMWDTAAAGSSRDPALAASAAVGEVCDITKVQKCDHCGGGDSTVYDMSRIDLGSIVDPDDNIGTVEDAHERF